MQRRKRAIALAKKMVGFTKVCSSKCAVVKYVVQMWLNVRGSMLYFKIFRYSPACDNHSNDAPMLEQMFSRTPKMLVKVCLGRKLPGLSTVIC
jgi:hypothetical protein